MKNLKVTLSLAFLLHVLISQGQNCNLPPQFNPLTCTITPFVGGCHTGINELSYSTIYDGTFITQTINPIVNITKVAIDKFQPNQIENCKEYVSIGYYPDEIVPPVGPSKPFFRIIVCKYDNDLNTIWANTYSLPALEASWPIHYIPKSIKVNELGESIICGEISYNIHRPSSAGIHTTSEAFIAKIDVNGTMVWFTQVTNEYNITSTTFSSINEIDIFNPINTQANRIIGVGKRQILNKIHPYVVTIDESNGVLLHSNTLDIIGTSARLFSSGQFNDVKYIGSLDPQNTNNEFYFSAIGTETYYEGTMRNNDNCIYTFRFDGNSVFPIDYRNFGKLPPSPFFHENNESGLKLSVNSTNNENTGVILPPKWSRTYGDVYAMSEFQDGQFTVSTNTLKINPIITRLNSAYLKTNNPLNAIVFSKMYDHSNPSPANEMIHPKAMHHECDNTLFLLNQTEDYNTFLSNYTSILEIDDINGSVLRDFHTAPLVSSSSIHKDAVDFVQTSTWNTHINGISNFGPAVLFNRIDLLKQAFTPTFEIQVKSGAFDFCNSDNRTVTTIDYQNNEHVYSYGVEYSLIEINDPQYLEHQSFELSLPFTQDCPRNSFECPSPILNLQKNEGNQSLIKMNFYPNPTNGNIVHFILENKSENELCNLEIIDAKGSLIKELKFINSVDIDFSEFNSGLFFVRVKVGESVLVGKLINSK